MTSKRRAKRVMTANHERMAARTETRANLSALPRITEMMTTMVSR
jgi:hypothetical protein